MLKMLSVNGISVTKSKKYLVACLWDIAIGSYGLEALAFASTGLEASTSKTDIPITDNDSSYSGN